jgi:hypothetical protein
MRSVAMPARLSLAFAFLFALTGCLETTAPEPIVEARIAHAAPGLGPAQVLLNGTPALQLAPGQNTFFPLNPATHDYEFVVGADTAGIRVLHDADINAIVLMNRDNPTAHQFSMERLAAQQIMVINGDFTSAESMTVEIVAEEETFADVVGAGEHFIIEPATGDFEIRIRPGGAEDFVEVLPFSLVHGDNGFLILVPVPDTPEAPYTRVLF